MGAQEALHDQIVVETVSLQSAMLAPVRSIAQPTSVRAFAAASPRGTDHWRHSKAAFKDWTKAAVAPGVSREKREFFGFCALAFGDVDTNKDGFINLEESDRLLESVAAVPRRYGLAPVSTMTTLERQMAHKKLSDQLDTKAGPARGVLGLDQFVEWAFDHVISKIGKVPAKDVGLYQVQDYSEEEHIGSFFSEWVEHKAKGRGAENRKAERAMMALADLIRKQKEVQNPAGVRQKEANVQFLCTP